MKLIIIEANQKFIESAGSVIKVFINKIGVFFYFEKKPHTSLIPKRKFSQINCESIYQSKPRQNYELLTLNTVEPSLWDFCLSLFLESPPDEFGRT